MIPSYSRDPLLLKELLGASRRGQTYWGRVIYVGVIGLILYQFWTTRIANAGTLSTSVYAELGRQLFRTFLYFQMLLVSLAAIGGAAERIIREDKNRTLGLLLLTPLTARGIVLSKWLASVFQAGSLILCGLPVVAVCVYLGGVGPEELLWSFSLTLSMAGLGAAFGLRASAIYHSVPRAIIMGVVYMIGYGLFPVILTFVTVGFGMIAAPFIHPLYAALFIDSGFGGRGFANLNYCWLPATLVSFFLSWLMVRGLAVRIRARVIAPPPTPPNFVQEQRHLAGRFSIPLKVGERPSRSYREVWESDPLLWKELLTHASARWSRESKLGYLIAGLLFIFLCWAVTLGESQGTLVFLGIFFLLLAIANGAALFAPEKEGRRMEMLLCAPVSSAAIVRSKLLSGLVAPESVRVSFLALATVLAFSWWSGPAGMLMNFTVFFGFLLFAFLLSAALSLHAATMQGAALAATGVLCVILLVVPMVTAIALPASAGELPGPFWLLSALHPVWVLDPISRPRGLDTAGAVGRFSLFMLLYGGASAGLVGWILWRFDRQMGRL